MYQGGQFPPPLVLGIDRSHRLTLGLLAFWPMWLGAQIAVRNIVTERAIPYTGTPIGKTLSGAGPSFRQNANTGFSVSSGESLGNCNSAPFTLAAELSAATGGSLNGLFSIRNSTTARNSFLINAANQVIYRTSYTTTADATSTTALDGRGSKTLRFAGVNYSTTDHRMFVNGVEENATTTSLTLLSSARNGLITGQSGGSNGRANDTAWIACWDRALSAEEIASLHSNPYQFLITP